MIIIEENNLMKLQAEENMMLQREECFTKEVILGCNDSPDNWNEITEELANQLILEIEEINKPPIE